MNQTKLKLVQNEPNQAQIGSKWTKSSSNWFKSDLFRPYLESGATGVYWYFQTFSRLKKVLDQKHWFLDLIQKSHFRAKNVNCQLFDDFLTLKKGLFDPFKSKFSTKHHFLDPDSTEFVKVDFLKTPALADKMILKIPEDAAWGSGSRFLCQALKGPKRGHEFCQIILEKGQKYRFFEKKWPF